MISISRTTGEVTGRIDTEKAWEIITKFFASAQEKKEDTACTKNT